MKTLILLLLPFACFGQHPVTLGSNSDTFSQRLSYSSAYNFEKYSNKINMDHTIYLLNGTEIKCAHYSLLPKERAIYYFTEINSGQVAGLVPIDKILYITPKQEE